MSDLIPTNTGMFGTTSRDGQRIGSGLARQTRREVEQIAARVEVEATAEQARAFLTASAMTNIATLVSQAESHMKVAPAGAQYYESLIGAYAISAGQRIAQL